MRYLAYKRACFYYWIGDKASKIMDYYELEWVDDILYPVYNYFMTRSMELSDKYVLGIWFDE